MYRLLRALYGYRKAPQLWQEWLAEKIISGCGCARAICEPAVFVRREGELEITIHVDEFLSSGSSEEVKELENRLRQRGVKVRIVGMLEKRGDDGLNRGLSWRLRGKS